MLIIFQKANQSVLQVPCVFPNEGFPSGLWVEGLLPSLGRKPPLLFCGWGSNPKTRTLGLALYMDPKSVAFLSSLPWNRLEATDPAGTCLPTINLESEHHQSCGTKLGLFSSNSKELTNT